MNSLSVITIAHERIAYSYISWTHCQSKEVIGTVLKLTFSCTLKEEPDNKYLEPSHTDHEPTFDNAEVEYPSLRALYGAEIAVLARPKVFLIPIDGREIARDLHDRLFESGGLFGGSALLRGQEGGGRLVFDLKGGKKRQ